MIKTVSNLIIVVFVKFRSYPLCMFIFHIDRLGLYNPSAIHTCIIDMVKYSSHNQRESNEHNVMDIHSNDFLQSKLDVSNAYYIYGIEVKKTYHIQLNDYFKVDAFNLIALKVIDK